MAIKRTFTIDEKLLTEFKALSKKNGKSYKRTIEEAITLWVKKYEPAINER